MTAEDLKNILDHLRDDELSTFQWFLHQPNIVQGLPAIRRSRLQTASRCDIVDMMMETYGDQRAVQVTRVVFEKISRKDLLQRFPASSSGPEVHVSDVGETSENREPSSSQTQPPLPQTEGVSEVQMEPADTERMKIPSVFASEMQMESKQISYRLSCTGPGVFQCPAIGVVFDMAQGATLKCSVTPRDESRLKRTGKEAAGLMYDIQCSEDAAVRRLHFPHCETNDDPRRDTEQRIQPQRISAQTWLLSVRTQLIQGLSDVPVNQVLDRLYQQNVISAEENSIIRAQVGEDKTRQLIDRVHRRGPDAISLLKTALREVDPFLCRNLNLL